MNAMEISSNKPLDYALVQCLRLFAQQGRRIRNQKLTSENCASDDEMMHSMLKVVHDKRTNKGEKIHIRQVVE